MIQAVKEWAEVLREGVDALRAYKRGQRADADWFFAQEVRMQVTQELMGAELAVTDPMHHARLLVELARRIPLRFLPGQALAGSMDCAFSPSYALINPAFRTAFFKGFCDPCAIYNDIKPDPERGLTPQRIAAVRDFWADEAFARGLTEAYGECGELTAEVVFFAEPVTGHIVPDLRELMQGGVRAAQSRARSLGTAYGEAMATALEAPLILAERYRELALSAAASASGAQAQRLEKIAHTLATVPAVGAQTLHDATQAYTLLWQCMVLEQAPNPYAISAGNLDRVLAPFYDAGRETRAEAVELVRHLLAFFQVGDRCWAISQNILAGGKDADGHDLTSAMTYILLDAFFASNDPQPALSVKLHCDTPQELYRNLGRFFFTAGQLTPSLFNDDALHPLLREDGVAPSDVADYGIAGCQEPLIMGKSSINTTNTWLNLAKVLELALNDGRSALTGKQLVPGWGELGFGNAADAYMHMPEVFAKLLEVVLPRMQKAGNACTELLGATRPVPFTSCLMSGLETGRDMRDVRNPGVPYTGSGCLVHGLSVVADSLHALAGVLAGGTKPEEIRAALVANFTGYEGLRAALLQQDKFGNGAAGVDAVAAELAADVCARIGTLRNPSGHAYKPDFSTPSTHLLYGYWVGATPDGRGAREMLGYGVDPRPGAAHTGLANRMVSAWRLPYRRMSGGYASHIGVDPAQLPYKLAADRSGSVAEKGLWLRDQVIAPLFRFGDVGAGLEERAPFYVYFNVEERGHLRAVLADPKRYAPSGVYIVRIHGTFVNLLDLSPDIQNDIIERLDPAASKL